MEHDHPTDGRGPHLLSQSRRLGDACGTARERRHWGPAELGELRVVVRWQNGRVDSRALWVAPVTLDTIALRRQKLLVGLADAAVAALVVTGSGGLARHLASFAELGAEVAEGTTLSPRGDCGRRRLVVCGWRVGRRVARPRRHGTCAGANPSWRSPRRTWW